MSRSTDFQSIKLRLFGFGYKDPVSQCDRHLPTSPPEARVATKVRWQEGHGSEWMKDVQQPPLRFFHQKHGTVGSQSWHCLVTWTQKFPKSSSSFFSSLLDNLAPKFHIPFLYLAQCLLHIMCFQIPFCFKQLLEVRCGCLPVAMGNLHSNGLNSALWSW